jgi:hypothetical protein
MVVETIRLGDLCIGQQPASEAARDAHRQRLRQEFEALPVDRLVRLEAVVQEARGKALRQLAAVAPEQAAAEQFDWMELARLADAPSDEGLSEARQLHRIRTLLRQADCADTPNAKQTIGDALVEEIVCIITATPGLVGVVEAENEDRRRESSGEAPFAPGERTAFVAAKRAIAETARRQGKLPQAWAATRAAWRRGHALARTVRADTARRYRLLARRIASARTRRVRFARPRIEGRNSDDGPDGPPLPDRIADRPTRAAVGGP